jgi:hypothetical protein
VRRQRRPSTKCGWLLLAASEAKLADRIADQLDGAGAGHQTECVHARCETPQGVRYGMRKVLKANVIDAQTRGLGIWRYNSAAYSTSAQHRIRAWGFELRLLEGAVSCELVSARHCGQGKKEW